jgi:hypothetical protein
MTESDPKFVEDIAGALHQIFRSAGMSMLTGPQMEQVRIVSENLAKTIEHRGEVKAVEVIQQLQDAVDEGFKSLEAAIEARDTEVEARLRALESRNLIMK